MIKMSRSIFVTLLVVLVVTSLLAAQCGGVGGTETVKLAFIGPLTGGNAAMGLGGRNSFELAVKEENENPDNKYTYEVVVIDDECKPDVGVQAALKAADIAVEKIDLTKHEGAHPRMGAVDVVPFVPLHGTTVGECIELSKEFAEEFSSKHNVPVYRREH